jgi:N6-adenosine-specific RNA methylase IME4
VIPFPDKKYNIIYADPAWNYETWSEGASRNVKGKYKTMTPKEIFDLPVQDISEEDCILFIWVTYPKLIEGIETIEQWGFKYKTCAFSWVKTNKSFAKDQSSFFPEDSFKSFWGMGYWTRANNEICLLGTKGKPKRCSKSVQQIVFDNIREHSRKPDCVRDRIVELCGDVPRIELFARQRHEGWDAWGNEI